MHLKRHLGNFEEKKAYEINKTSYIKEKIVNVNGRKYEKCGHGKKKFIN